MAKVLILAKYWHPFEGGIEDSARSVANHLARMHQVEVVAFDHGHRVGIERVDELLLHRCATPLVVKSQPLSWSYVHAILRAEADLIYFHAPNVLASLALLLKLMIGGRRVPVITMHHMDIFGRRLLRALARSLYDRVLRRSSRLIVTSLKNAVISGDIRVPVRTVAIPLGISLEQFHISPGLREEARVWRRSLCGDAPVVAFLGRHARYKGLDVLMRALAQRREVHALIGGDGPFREPTAALARELGVPDRVHLLGALSHEEKLRLLAAADVFAFPSTEITEAFGVSQLEAMAVGCPVVATNLPTGVTDVSVNEKTALLVPPGDARALADAIGRLLNDRALAERLAGEARQRVAENYTIARMVERNIALIAEVLAEEPLVASERRIVPRATTAAFGDGE